MNIAAERVNFTKYICNQSRKLDGRCKAVVLLTCGIVTYKWSQKTFPTKPFATYRKKIIVSACPLHDNIEASYFSGTKQQENVEKKSSWFTKIAPFLFSQESVQSPAPPEVTLTPDIITLHLKNLGLETSSITAAIEQVNKQNKKLEISLVLNELLKQNEDGILALHSPTTEYRISAHSTTIKENVYGSEELNKNRNYTIKTDFEAQVREGRDSMASPARAASLLTMALSSVAAMSIYNEFAPRYLSSLNKLSSSKSHAVRIAYGCAASFILAFPALQFIKSRHESHYPPERTPRFLEDSNNDDMLYIWTCTRSDYTLPKEEEEKTQEKSSSVSDVVSRSLLGTAFFATCGYVVGTAVGAFLVLV